MKRSTVILLSMFLFFVLLANLKTINESFVTYRFHRVYNDPSATSDSSQGWVLPVIIICSIFAAIVLGLIIFFVVNKYS